MWKNEILSFHCQFLFINSILSMDPYFVCSAADLNPVWLVLQFISLYSCVQGLQVDEFGTKIQLNINEDWCHCI